MSLPTNFFIGRGSKLPWFINFTLLGVESGPSYLANKSDPSYSTVVANGSNLARNNYATDTNLLSVSSGVVSVLIPAGEHRIEMYGAKGGDATYDANDIRYGGRGAKVSFILDQSSDSIYKFIVGHSGQTSTTGTNVIGAAGGGGATWMFSNNSLTNTYLIAVAGAGGGASGYNSPSNNGTQGQGGGHGESSTSGGLSSGWNSGNPSAVSVGNGGDDGSWTGWEAGAGGCGINSDGSDSQQNTSFEDAYGGHSPANGSEGGHMASSGKYAGGFGGGGAGGFTGGGGGGYTGGSGGGFAGDGNFHGGGGGSYVGTFSNLSSSSITGGSTSSYSGAGKVVINTL